MMLTLGAFAFDPAAGRLTRDGRPVTIGGRALAVLTALAHAEGTVTKEALLTAAWPGLTVEEGNLTVQVAALRKLLGDDAIVTVPRVGYRLRTGAAGPAAGLPRVAVRPLEVIGGDDGDAALAAGLAQDMITALGRFRQFVVLSRPTAADAAAAGLSYGLEGSLRRAAGRLRISARLADARGAQLWARSFDGAPGDIFSFLDGITASVAASAAPGIEAAEIARVRRERPASAAAHDLYLRALPEIYSETEQGNLRAEALLERAVAIEPENGLYLAHLSWVLEHRFSMCLSTLRPEDPARAIACARAALLYAGGDPRSLCHAAATLCFVAADFAVGIAAIERAMADNPDNVAVLVNAGVIFLAAGDLPRSEALFRKCLQLSPADPGLHMFWCGLANIALLSGDFEAARERALRALAANPVFDPSHWMLVSALAHLGRTDEAAGALARLRAQTPGLSLSRLAATGLNPGDLLLDGLRRAGLPD
jgi:TolB-like protein